MSLPQYNFNNAIPAADNNPSADQPEMLNNNRAAVNAIAVDHIGYGTSGTGYHQWVRMRKVNPVNTVPPVIATYGGVYTNTATSVGAGTETNLYYTPDASGRAYQLSRTIDANFAQFATNTNYAPIVANRNGGWTFLPGGLMLQYGIADVAASGTVTTVVFPVAYTGVPFSITIGSITGEGNSPGENNQFIKEGTVSTTQFQVVNSSGSPNRKIYWQAIGK